MADRFVPIAYRGGEFEGSARAMDLDGLSPFHVELTDGTYVPNLWAADGEQACEAVRKMGILGLDVEIKSVEAAGEGD